MICLAKIVATKGVKGFVKIKSFTKDPLDLLNYKMFYDATGKRKIPIKIIGREKDYFVGLIENAPSREQAFMYKGTELFVDKGDLPSLPENEFYHDELIGLEAKNLNSKQSGQVMAVRNFGAGDLLDIRNETGASELIPFRDAFIPEINLKKGFLTYYPVNLTDEQRSLQKTTSPRKKDKPS